MPLKSKNIQNLVLHVAGRTDCEQTKQDLFTTASEKIPISGLGPDRHQCPNMVPKKAQFASQVPKLFDWS